jgi:RHS repeat-associated protein
MAKSYGYNDGHNNGNVMSATNNKDANRTQTFTYDPLNRITSGWSQASSGALSWGENYSIDAWGNLQMAPMAGKAHGGTFQIASDGNNHATGLPYDAAGNLTAYNSSAYTYDAGNMMKTVGSTTYWYDADGQRFQKWLNGAGSKTYWYGAGGETLDEGDAAGNLTSEYVYFGGKRTARIDLPANTVHYYLSDHLNSTSQVVSSSGVIEEESDYSPFGTEVVVTGPGANHYKFTGKERDAESGLDYFGARHYSNGLGRFTTPDWSAVPVPVPYADLGDPQSLNQYSYVRNIPTVKVDPDGHDTNGLDHKVEGFDQRMDQVDAFVIRALNHPAVQAILDLATFGAGGSAVEGGIARGVEQGAARGVEKGVAAGVEKGVAAGVEKGVAAGVEKGVAAGVEKGVAAGVEKGAVKASTSGGRAASQINRAAFSAERKAFWKAEAKANPEKYSAENLARMDKGKPPIGSDGHPMELHHADRTQNGPLQPMTRTDHRLGDNYQKNHPD